MTQNKVIVPGSKKALENLKYEIASEHENYKIIQICKNMVVLFFTILI